MKYQSWYRIIVIVWMAIKFLYQIVWFRWFHRVWDEDTKRKWKQLLADQAVEYRKKAVRLEGLLIKFGQFLSTRADLLPEVFIKELEGLVDRVDPVPYYYSKKILEQEWGMDYNHHLKELSKQPVASASIGEVYKAKLQDGTPVAIKIQRYRVEKIFHTDFKALRIVFWMLNRFTQFGQKADLPALYNELVSTISRELDFNKELQNGIYFKNRYSEFEKVYVPHYYEQLTTRRVLVMEWIEGAKVTDSNYIKANHVNREILAKHLFDLFVDQLVFDGYFHADPHAGNLMVRADGSLVMIDFGMVGEVKKQDAEHIRQMIKGFILDDYDLIITSLKEMHFLLPSADEQKVKKILKETAAIYLSSDIDKFDADTLQKILRDLQVFVKEQPIQLPADYAFLGRAASIVIGVLSAIYPEIDLMEWGSPVVREWISGKRDSKSSFYTEILKESAKPLLSLPKTMVNFLQNADRETARKKQEFHSQSLQTFYRFYSSLLFVLFVLGMGSSVLGYILMLPALMYVGGGISIITGVCLLAFYFKYKKTIKKGR